MTQRSRSVIKTFFETQDKPTQGQFADAWDSFLNLIDDFGRLAEEHDQTRTYDVGSKAIKFRVIWKATVQNSGTFDPSQWIPIAGYELDDAATASDKILSAQEIDSRITDALGMAGILASPVQDLTALKAIDTSDSAEWPDKIMINVEDNGLYRLDRQSSVAEDAPRIITPDTGTGRWYKMSTHLNDHNNLQSVQGGTTGEYYHLTQTEYNQLITGFSQSQVIYVNVNGFSGTPEKGNPFKPYQDAPSAISAAVSGDIIFFVKGDFTANSITPKDGVNMFLFDSDIALASFSPVSISFTIYGSGTVSGYSNGSGGGTVRIDPVLSGNVTDSSAGDFIANGGITGNYTGSGSFSRTVKIRNGVGGNVQVDSGFTLYIKGDIGGTYTVNNTAVVHIVGRISGDVTFNADSTQYIDGDIHGNLDCASSSTTVYHNGDIINSGSNTAAIRCRYHGRNCFVNLSMLNLAVVYMTGVDGDLSAGDESKANITGDISGSMSTSGNASLSIVGNVSGAVTVAESSKVYVYGNLQSSFNGENSSIAVVYGDIAGNITLIEGHDLFQVGNVSGTVSMTFSTNYYLIGDINVITTGPSVSITLESATSLWFQHRGNIVNPNSSGNAIDVDTSAGTDGTIVLYGGEYRVGGANSFTQSAGTDGVIEVRGTVVVNKPAVSSLTINKEGYLVDTSAGAALTDYDVEVTDPSKGLILNHSNGTRARATLAQDGNGGYTIEINTI